MSHSLFVFGKEMFNVYLHCWCLMGWSFGSWWDGEEVLTHASGILECLKVEWNWFGYTLGTKLCTYIVLENEE
jgi:hypothetical protein